jgi:hypothetical protein
VGQSSASHGRVESGGCAHDPGDNHVWRGDVAFVISFHGDASSLEVEISHDRGRKNARCRTQRRRQLRFLHSWAVEAGRGKSAKTGTKRQAIQPARAIERPWKTEPRSQAASFIKHRSSPKDQENSRSPAPETSA